MIYTLIVIALIIWLLGLVLDFAGGFIHLLLLVAAVMFIYDLITKRR